MVMIQLKIVCVLLMFELSRSDTSTEYSQITGCHNGWIVYEGYCYLFSSTAIRPVEAEHYCQQHGGHMVEVFSSKENAFIKDQLKKIKPHCAWIGLTDENTEGSWRWLSNPNPLNFTDWYPGETVHDNEDCGGFWSTHGYKWEDAPCTLDCLPICKQRGVVEFPNIIG